ncbi:hypothetical protein G3N56_00650 [Desulfovibrio sulfodismutans]|uniref:Uncharacterized protein n=1 Tax=Desulfolutivibrio sulfodismutans TaxID=63561 RepID=A0A7K3NGD8_9BACT|nr:hypothetical protein [Desulfolutivibrio sulfodismutans]NDY55254.1 hypothetical protein [Desulfolutivibrio sulfodismutans]QLA12985.1 hypothetical protein GD606_12260 [Desulfolutivibrio sulfodismutans DSM 3696]
MKNKPSVPGYAGKRRTPLQAIAAFCRECFGGPAGACASADCPFHPYRQGTFPDGASRNVVAVVRRYCEGCAAADAPGGCTAGGVSPGLEPCPCWPFRLGRNPYVGAGRQESPRQQAPQQLGLADAQAAPIPGSAHGPGDAADRRRGLSHRKDAP